jgi:hypothetical protein
MIDLPIAARWMLSQLTNEDCLYQDDVIDYLVSNNAERFCRENSDGNLVLGRELLNEFRKLTETNVVWVKPDRYWRYRVVEDEPGRDASG